MQLFCFIYINVTVCTYIKMTVVSKPISGLLSFFFFFFTLKTQAYWLSLREQLRIVGYNLLMIMEI